MQIITLIPVRLNDGTPVGRKKLKAITRRLALQFGGCTIDEDVRGIWIDPSDQQEYEDEFWRVTIVCNNERLSEAQAEVLIIGRDLGQKAMFFEIRDFDGVRILDVPDE